MAFAGNLAKAMSPAYLIGSTLFGKKKNAPTPSAQPSMITAVQNTPSSSTSLLNSNSSYGG